MSDDKQHQPASYNVTVTAGAIGYGDGATVVGSLTVYGDGDRVAEPDATSGGDARTFRADSMRFD